MTHLAATKIKEKNRFRSVYMNLNLTNLQTLLCKKLLVCNFYKEKGKSNNAIHFAFVKLKVNEPHINVNSYASRKRYHVLF